MEKEISAAVAPRSRWRWLLWSLRVLAFLGVVGLLVFLGNRQAQEKIELIKPIEFIGHSDDAAYALMGKSLSEGRGILVNYVTTFYRAYPPTITRREDHWPPFMGFAIAPLFHFMGVKAWVARLPSIFFASVGLPLATAWLAYVLSRRGYVALLAGLVIMADPQIYQQSLRTIADGTTAMLVAAFCAALITARRYPWAHLLAGMFGACAYYAKGSELVLIALYPLLAALVCGLEVFRMKRFYAAIVVFLCLVGPFWYANYREYGNPLHSTQNYVSAFYGFESWETKHYFPYWGENLPKVSDRWNKHPTAYWLMSREQLASASALVLTGDMDRGSDMWADFGTYGLRLRQFIVGQGGGGFFHALLRAPLTNPPVKHVTDWQSPPWELAGVFAVALLVAAVVALPVFVIAAVVRGVRRFRARRGKVMLRPTSPIDPSLRAAPVAALRSRLCPSATFVGPALAVWTVLLMHLVFISFFWEVAPRFCFPMLPLMLALGAAGASRFLEWPIRGVAWATTALAGQLQRPVAARVSDRGTSRWGQRYRGVAMSIPTVLTLAAAMFVWINREPVYAAQTDMLDRGNVRGDYPFEQDDRYIATGKWIAKKYPTAVIMCRNPWELVFSMGPANKGVGLPNPIDEGQKGADILFAIARYYHVTHFLADEVRPAMEPYFVRRKPGLKRVRGAPDALYEIDWSVIPYKTVEQALGRVPMTAPATAPATQAASQPK